MASIFFFFISPVKPHTDEISLISSEVKSLLHKRNYSETIKRTSVVSNSSFRRRGKEAESDRLKRSLNELGQLGHYEAARGFTSSISRSFINRFHRNYLDESSVRPTVVLSLSLSLADQLPLSPPENHWSYLRRDYWPSKFSRLRDFHPSVKITGTLLLTTTCNSRHGSPRR